MSLPIHHCDYATQVFCRLLAHIKKTEEIRTKLALQSDFNLEAAYQLFSAQSFEQVSNNLLPFTEEYASLVVDRS
jgi:hypothetical protein